MFRRIDVAILALTFLATCCTGAACLAQDIRFGYDPPRTHAYQPPRDVHPSLAPESPKHFRPGYGYESAPASFPTVLPSYSKYYAFGIRKTLPLSAAPARRRATADGGPWYFPGGATNAQDFRFGDDPPSVEPQQPPRDVQPSRAPELAEHLRPGYAYDSLPRSFPTLHPSYSTYYAFGIRQTLPLSAAPVRRRAMTSRGPWYFPGAATRLGDLRYRW